LNESVRLPLLGSVMLGERIVVTPPSISKSPGSPPAAAPVSRTYQTLAAI
jgi:hypothetical protein